MSNTELRIATTLGISKNNLKRISKSYAQKPRRKFARRTLSARYLLYFSAAFPSLTSALKEDGKTKIEADIPH